MTTPLPPPEDLPRPAWVQPVAEGRIPAGRTVGTIASEVLFAGAQEVQIAHRGSLYRLKQTALGKLILTK